MFGMGNGRARGGGGDSSGLSSSEDRVAHRADLAASCYGVRVRYARLLQEASSSTTTSTTCLQGRVTKKHLKEHLNEDSKPSFTYHINTAYQVVDDGGHCHHYTREFAVSREVWNRTHEGSDVGLVILPGYPRSALLCTTVQQVDPDMRPPIESESEEAYTFGAAFYYCTAFVTAIPYLPYLVVFGAATIYWIVTATAIVGVIPVLFLAVAYCGARSRRNAELHCILYGAVDTPQLEAAVSAAHHGTKIAGRDPSAAADVVPKRVSYNDFCPEDKQFFLRTFSFMVLHWAWHTIVLAYWVVFGGSQLAWYVAIPWNRRLLDRYREEAGVCRVEGVVVCRESMGSTIVRYDVGVRSYKKRFWDHNTLNYRCAVVGQELDGRTILRNEVGDGTYESQYGHGRYRIAAAHGSSQSVELVYLKGLPRSALPMAVLTKLFRKETSRLESYLKHCLYLVPGQIIAICSLFYFLTSLQSDLLLAGAITGCYVMMGYLGWWYARYWSERDVLYGRPNDCVVLTGGLTQHENIGRDGDRRSTTETELTNAVDGVSENGGNEWVTVVSAEIFDSTIPMTP